jgi:hypothetical protein
MIMLKPFLQQPYMNLENLQLVDQIVILPVWFVQDENNLFIQSIAKSLKL